MSQDAKLVSYLEKVLHDLEGWLMKGEVWT
jgi:hypothetical protein